MALPSIPSPSSLQAFEPPNPPRRQFSASLTGLKELERGCEDRQRLLSCSMGTREKLRISRSTIVLLSSIAKQRATSRASAARESLKAGLSPKTLSESSKALTLPDALYTGPGLDLSEPSSFAKGHAKWSPPAEKLLITKSAFLFLQNVAKASSQKGNCRSFLFDYLSKDLQASERVSDIEMAGPSLSSIHHDAREEWSVLHNSKSSAGGQIPLYSDTGAVPRQETEYLSAAAPLHSFLGLKSGRSGKVRVFKAPTKKYNSVTNSGSQFQLEKSKLQELKFPIISTEPTTVVVSSALVNKRSIYKSIRAAYQTATYIERADCELGAVNGHNVPFHPSRVDMELAPDVGLIHVTIQQLHQRGIPSHTSLTPSPSSDQTAPRVHSQILRATTKYSTLLVLVSQGLPAKSPLVPLSAADCSAVSRLVALGQSVQSQGTNCRVTLCAGGEAELARWTVAMMHQYRMPLSLAFEMGDESRWERWLWRAGVSTLMAQEMISAARERETGLAGVVTSAIEEDVKGGRLCPGAHMRLRRLICDDW